MFFRIVTFFSYFFFTRSCRIFIFSILFYILNKQKLK